MVAAIIWLLLCLGMGIQSNHIGLSFGLWLFTMVFVILSTGSGTNNQQNSQEQDIYYQKLLKKRREQKSKKGRIEYTKKKR